MYKRILLAYDGSESGQKALLDCHDIAQWSQAELHLVAVMPSLTAHIAVDGGVYDAASDAQLRATYQKILDDGLHRLAESGHVARGELLVGDSVREITQYARRIDADLIVVGHKHLEGWAARWWRGATSPALIEHAHCSVLVVITH
jgi:nucleotide-binding universal stress UspA family protein